MSNMTPIVGAHMSTKNGMQAIFKDSFAINGNTAQVFTANPRQWGSKKYGEEEIAEYFSKKEQYPEFKIVSHASYLINIASVVPEKRESAINSFMAELKRCGTFKIPYVVLHPGSFTGGERSEGIAAISESLGELIRIAEEEGVTILLENTGGQGSYLGATFEELAEIIDKTAGGKENLGVCIDTCHLFVAGYDLREDENYENVWANFEKSLGFDFLKALHLNDTDKDLGSKSDRHTDIGEGILSLLPFELIMNDKRFINIPKILETPGDDQDHARNIALLRGMYKG